MHPSSGSLSCFPSPFSSLASPLASPQRCEAVRSPHPRRRATPHAHTKAIHHGAIQLQKSRSGAVGERLRGHRAVAHPTQDAHRGASGLPNLTHSQILCVRTGESGRRGSGDEEGDTVRTCSHSLRGCGVFPCLSSQQPRAHGVHAATRWQRCATPALECATSQRWLAVDAIRCAVTSHTTTCHLTLLFRSPHCVFSCAHVRGRASRSCGCVWCVLTCFTDAQSEIHSEQLS